MQQSQTEITIRVCSEIVRRLLDAHDNGEDVNLNALKASVARKHGAKMVPRLVDIISAVPHEVKDILLPKLRAKPVRTASGASPLPRLGLPLPSCRLLTFPLNGPDRCRRRHEQAASVSAHRYDRKHLRVRVPSGCASSSADPRCYPVNSYCPGGPDSDFEYSTQSYTVRLRLAFSARKTSHKLIPVPARDTSRLRCGPSGPVTTLTSSQRAALSS